MKRWLLVAVLLLPLSGCGTLLFQWLPYDCRVVVNPPEAELFLDGQKVERDEDGKYWVSLWPSVPQHRLELRLGQVEVGETLYREPVWGEQRRILFGDASPYTSLGVWKDYGIRKNWVVLGFVGDILTLGLFLPVDYVLGATNLYPREVRLDIGLCPTCKEPFGDGEACQHCGLERPR